MRRCYLHIGPHKTASTYLQAQAAGNERRLRELGLHILHSGRNRKYAAHQRLFEGLAKDSLSHALVAALRKELSTLPPDMNVFISNENFSHFHRFAGSYQRAQELFAALDCELRVVAFVRNPVDVLNSTYAEQTKRFLNIRPWNIYWQRALKSGAFDIWRIFDGWLTAFDCRILPLAQSIAAGRLEQEFF